MKKIATALSVVLLAATPFAAQSTPDDDLKAFRSYFTNKFPEVPVNDFINGVYSIDAASREQWEAFEEFPSYEIATDNGEEKFNKKFANGKGYADCFPNYKTGIKQNYPYFDTDCGIGFVNWLNRFIGFCGQKRGDTEYYGSLRRRPFWA